jgi:CheY-like chemotaxis protein
MNAETGGELFAPARVANNGASSATPQRTVMLIEDHDLVRLGTCVLLDSIEDVACTVVQCKTLDEAQQVLRTGRSFDLVLLDLNLGDSKGLQGLRSLREEFPALVVAVLSGTQDEGGDRLPAQELDPRSDQGRHPFAARRTRSAGAGCGSVERAVSETRRHVVLRPGRGARSAPYPDPRIDPVRLQQSGDQQRDPVVAWHGQELRVGNPARARRALTRAPDQPVSLVRQVLKRLSPQSFPDLS